MVKLAKNDIWRSNDANFLSVGEGATSNIEIPLTLLLPDS